MMSPGRCFFKNSLILGLWEQQPIAVNRVLVGKILRQAERRWGRQFVRGHLYANKTWESSFFLDIQKYFGSFNSHRWWTLNPLVGYVSFQLLNIIFEWVKMEKRKGHIDMVKPWKACEVCSGQVGPSHQDISTSDVINDSEPESA